ncbi:hypothetical protein K525DRAFT_274791 [Schizophyllum commune Loenen D]|nr:hypothetical protein K525DRAFT_274791 [Schizophyllum commune Loenen D]
MYSQRHLPGYTNDRCDACGELAPKTIDRMKHYKSHLPEGSAGWKMFRPGYECYLCPKSHNLKKKDALISHLACHHIPSLQYACPECPETYSNRGNLSVHRTKWHNYVPNAPKPAEASDPGAHEGAVAALAASVDAGLLQMALDFPAGALRPLRRLSATDRHSQEETPYATSEASLPGLFDETTPGPECDLGRASSSTTPLMTPPPPHCAESSDTPCYSGFGQSSGHGFEQPCGHGFEPPYSLGFGLPALGGFNPYLNLSGVNVGDFSHGVSVNLTAGVPMDLTSGAPMDLTSGAPMDLTAGAPMRMTAGVLVHSTATSAHSAQPSNGEAQAFPHAAVPPPPQDVRLAYPQPSHARTSTPAHARASTTAHARTSTPAHARDLDTSACEDLDARAHDSINLADFSHTLAFPASHALAFTPADALAFPASHALTFPASHTLAFPASHALAFTPANAMDVAASYAVNLADIHSFDVADIDRFDVADVDRFGVADVDRFGVADLYRFDVADVDSFGDADIYRFGDAGMY